MAQLILVVDDDPLTRRVVQHYLERAGYQVISTGAGREAIQLARRELPKLILLDMVLPDVDGSTVLEQLRQAEATSAIPVVRLSGNMDQSSRSPTLAKPINADQLLEVARRLIPEIAEDSACDDRM